MTARRRLPRGLTGLAVALIAACTLVAGCTGTSPGHGSAATSGAPSPASGPASGTRNQASGAGAPGSGTLPAGESSFTLQVAGEQRHVLLERPASGAHRRPLVIFLHGATNSGAQVRDQLAMNDQARQAGVLLAFPDGDPVHHSWRAGCCGSYARSDRDFRFLVVLIHDLVADGEVDPAHVALGGFSAGALLANSFACQDPGLVRGVLAVAGALLEPPAFVHPAISSAPRCTPSRPVTVLELHGLSDSSVPVAGTTANCSSSPCIPGAKAFLAPAATIDSWWRRLDGCGAPVVRDIGAGTASLAACRAGTSVGLALVPGVQHDLPGLVHAFPVTDTLLQLATGERLSAW